MGEDGVEEIDVREEIVYEFEGSLVMRLGGFVGVLLLLFLSGLILISVFEFKEEVESFLITRNDSSNGFISEKPPLIPAENGPGSLVTNNDGGVSPTNNLFFFQIKI